jgi:outer membrane protein TolC
VAALGLVALLAAGAALAQPARAERWSGGELTLDQAIATALARNPGYAAANLAAEAAASAAREAKDKLRPQVTAGGSYDRYLADAGDGPQATVTATQSYPGLRPVVVLPGYPLPLPPAALAGLAGDQARLRAEKARNDLLFHVTQAYYNLLKAERLTEVQRAARQSAEAARKEAEAKLASGTATRVDLLRAETEVANAELAVVKAANARMMAESALFTLLGLEPPADPVACAPAPEVSEPGGTLDTLTTQALARRPEVAEARLNLDRAVSDKDQAALALLPTVSLSGSLTGDRHAVSSSWNPVTGTLAWTASVAGGPTAASGAVGRVSPSGEDWNVGVSVTYPLYDAGALREAALRAKLQVAQAEQHLEQAKGAVVSEVQAAWLELAEAKLSVEAARQAVGPSAEVWRLTKLRVEHGVGTPSELLEANAQDLQARVNLVQAEFARRLAVVKLKKATGLW